MCSRDWDIISPLRAGIVPPRFSFGFGVAWLHEETISAHRPDAPDRAPRRPCRVGGLVCRSAADGARRPRRGHRAAGCGHAPGQPADGRRRCRCQSGRAVLDGEDGRQGRPHQGRQLCGRIRAEPAPAHQQAGQGRRDPARDRLHRGLDLPPDARRARRAPRSHPRHRRDERHRGAAPDRRHRVPPRRPVLSRYLPLRQGFVRSRRTAQRL